MVRDHLHREGRLEKKHFKQMVLKVTEIISKTHSSKYSKKIKKMKILKKIK